MFQVKPITLVQPNLKAPNKYDKYDEVILKAY